MLWSAAFQPESLEACTIHRHATDLMGAMASAGNKMAHLLVYGGMGGGKSTRVRGLLHALYGPKAWKRRHPSTKTFDIGKSKAHTMTVYQSPFHVELDAVKLGAKDRVVVQHFIKTMAEEVATTEAPLVEEDKASTTRRPFVIVVIEQANKLSMDAQQGLRRTMEVYEAHCKIVLTASTTDGIIPAILSRVAPIRVPLASDEATMQVLNEAATAYGEPDLEIHKSTFIKIVHASQGNLKKALLAAQAAVMLERTKIQSLSKLVKSTVLDMVVRLPSPATVIGMRPTLAEHLGSVLFPSELLGALMDVGSLLLERRKRAGMIPTWIAAICEAEQAIHRSASPLAATEYVLLVFAGFFAK